MSGRLQDPGATFRDAPKGDVGDDFAVDFYDSILSSMSEGVVVHDGRGRIVSCNGAAERILGLTAEQLLASGIGENLPLRTIREDGSNFPAERHPAAVTLHTGRPQRGVVMGLVRRRRRPTWISINSEPIVRDGETRAVAVSFTDVTRSMEAARELRRRNRELILLNRIIAHCAAAEDAGELLAKVSAQLASKLGFERVEVVPADSDQEPASSAGRGTIFPIRAPGHRPSALRLEPGAGNVIGATRLRSVRMVVEQVESALTRIHLSQQHREAQKMEALGRLAGGIAHDFNNLLTAIQGHAALGLTCAVGNEGARGHLVGIQETGRRAAHLTGKLLTFVRGRVSSADALCLDEALRQMSDLLRRLLPENIQLVFHTGADRSWVRADSTDLEQIVINLVVNAVDAMPEGGRIDLQTENCELAGTSWVALRVLDEGVGIEPATLHRIFEPLYTTKERDRGTGLGLATVHSIVEAGGGRVQVDSRLGVGTTFEVLLPRIESPASHSNEILYTELPSGEGRTVLLVEDDVYLRPLLLRAFKDAGYAVLAAARDGEAALRAIHDMEHLEVELDLVVADVVLPRLDGRAVVEALRQRFVRLSAILMSGYPGDTARRIHDLPPRTAFLEKPFEPIELLRLAAQLMRSAESSVPGPRDH